MGMKKGGPENTASMHLHCLAAPDLTNAARSSSTMIPLSLHSSRYLFELFFFTLATSKKGPALLI